jgi:hypothetical protein
MWDSENMRFTNSDEANRYVQREYRKGWELTGKGILTSVS